MAENMIIAGESMGLGSCFSGMASYYAKKIIGEYNLADRVFPVVQLVMGYPAEDKPTRPRFHWLLYYLKTNTLSLMTGKLKRQYRRWMKVIWLRIIIGI